MHLNSIEKWFYRMTDVTTTNWNMCIQKTTARIPTVYRYRCMQKNARPYHNIRRSHRPASVLDCSLYQAVSTSIVNITSTVLLVKLLSNCYICIIRSNSAQHRQQLSLLFCGCFSQMNLNQPVFSLESLCFTFSKTETPGDKWNGLTFLLSNRQYQSIESNARHLH